MGEMGAESLRRGDRKLLAWDGFEATLLPHQPLRFLYFCASYTIECFVLFLHFLKSLKCTCTIWRQRPAALSDKPYSMLLKKTRHPPAAAAQSSSPLS